MPDRYSFDFGIKSADGFDYGVLFVFAEFGVEGEGEDFGGGAFGVGEVAGAVAEGGESGLLVEAEGVVDFGADALRGEVGAEVVAAGSADDVLVEDVLGAGMGVGQDDAGCDGVGLSGEVQGGDAGCEEELVVAGGEVAAALVPGGEVAEFDREDGGLEGVEAGVPADFVVEVAAGHAVGAEGAGAGVDGGGAGGDEAGVAEGGEVLGGVEAEGGGVAEGAGGDGVPGGAEGLGGVLDEQEAGVLELEGDEGVEVGALAEEVDGEDGVDRGVAARTSAAATGERLKVRGSMSAKRGMAPARRMAEAEAKKLKGEVMTAWVRGCVGRPWSPMPAAARASQRASVPLAQPMPWGRRRRGRRRPRRRRPAGRG